MPTSCICTTQPDPQADINDSLAPKPDILVASSSNVPQPVDVFQRKVLLTEGMNALKQHVNAEKQTQCDNPTHSDPVSAGDELNIPVSTVPILSTVQPFFQGLWSSL